MEVDVPRGSGEGGSPMVRVDRRFLVEVQLVKLVVNATSEIFV